MNHIQPIHLTLADLLRGRLFKIPDYQRAYSWETRQRKDLFHDIRKVLDKGMQQSHFMATIVCLRRSDIRLGTDRYSQLDIVDGQQRLTTLIILLNSIKIALEKSVPQVENELRDLASLLVKPDGDNLLLLQTNHGTSRHFAKFLRHGSLVSPASATTEAGYQILMAIQECQEFVEQSVNYNVPLLSLYYCVKNCLSFILYELPDEKLVYTVFEVLNSRGMEVSWLDRLKNVLMGKAFELEGVNKTQLINDLHNIWKEIYAVVGLRKGLSTEALKFAATLYCLEKPSRLLGERGAVDEFQGRIDSAGTTKETAKAIRNAAEWILDVTNACDKVVSSRRQHAVTRILQSRLLATSIHLRTDIDMDDRANMLSNWENISFRIYGILGKDARYEVGTFTRLAWSITNGRITEDTILSEMDRIGNRYPIEDVIGELRNVDCYNGWTEQLRYLMFRYEEYLTSQRDMNFQNEQWERIWEESPSKSIEHIIPQSRAEEDFKHRLGNLMILPPRLNSKLKDKPTEEKLQSYRSTGLLTAIEVADMSPWTSETVKRREDTILDWARREWGEAGA